MSGKLHQGAQCYGGYVDGRLVAFSAFVHFPHPKIKNLKMGHRLVVLPDWQGLGIGGKFDDWLGEYLWHQGMRYHNVVAHPAMIAHYSASPRWAHLGTQRHKLVGRTSSVAPLRKHHADVSLKRIVSSFEYRSPKGGLAGEDFRFC